MERLELDAFLTLARELHFGRTAERMHLSAGRISQLIKQIERRIGAPLFERTGRGVLLTPIGRDLAAELAPAHEAIKSAVQRAIEAGRGLSGTLTFGAIEAAFHLFDTAVRDFQARNPTCVLRFRIAPLSDPFAMLRQGEIDVLACWLPVHEPDFAVSPAVFSEPLIVAVATRHPFATRASITFSDLSRDVVIRPASEAPPYWTAAISPRRTPDGRPIPDGPQAGSLLEALALASIGQGMVVVAAHVAKRAPRPDLVYVPIADAPALQWGLAWRKAGETARVRRFVDAVLDEKNR